jgi:hypothetical protein
MNESDIGATRKEDERERFRRQERRRRERKLESEIGDRKERRSHSSSPLQQLLVCNFDQFFVAPVRCRRLSIFTCRLTCGQVKGRSIQKK